MKEKNMFPKSAARIFMATSKIQYLQIIEANIASIYYSNYQLEKKKYYLIRLFYLGWLFALGAKF